MSTRAPIPPLLLAAAMLAVPGCDLFTGPSQDPVRIDRLPRELSPGEAALIRTSNAFTFDMLRQAPVADPDTPNVFLSPLSASMALGMTLNGAAGDTWTEMRDALGFAEMDEPAINLAYADLIGLLRGLDPRVEFAIANSLWARLGVPFHSDFLDRARTWFDAEVRDLDFLDPGAPDAINAWVADKTGGRIDDLLDEVPADAIMYLVNAIYFDGDWLYQFDPESTRPRPFTRADGSTAEVDMMMMEADLRYSFGDDATLLELPYGGGAFTAVAALPTGGRGIGDLVAGLDARVWDEWTARLETGEPAGIAVAFPKVKLRYDRLLNADLQALGMKAAFDSTKADFTRMTPLADTDPVWVSRVQQQTFLEIDERGTEAAAATYVEMVTIISLPSIPQVAFDRPFLFAIRERLSGTVLFIGVIGDPSAT